MNNAAIGDVLHGYAASAHELIPRFESLSSEQLYEPVIDLFPTMPSKIADIGAGTGRDAAWLATMGHSVTAVEPVDSFRRAGVARHQGLGIVWLDDRLPELNLLLGRANFDLVLMAGVWQHLDEHQRVVAIKRLIDLIAPGGRLILSLRHGPGALNRPVHDARPDDTIDAAASVGFGLERRRQARSVQEGNRSAGVLWTWLVLRSSRF